MDLVLIQLYSTGHCVNKPYPNQPCSNVFVHINVILIEFDLIFLLNFF